MQINSYKNHRGRFVPTAVRLATALECPLVNVHNPRGVTVNWGMNVHCNPDEPVLNMKAPIAKDIAFMLLRGAGVSVPNFLIGPVIRRRVRHAGGTDIRHCKAGHFYVQEVDKAEEYRVEVFNGVAFRGHRKYPTNPPNTQAFNWNRENTTWESYGYRNVEQVGTDVVQRGLDAVTSLGYDFGAVDIIRDTAGELYVLEVNSAPHLMDAGVSKYAWRIRNWVENL